MQNRRVDIAGRLDGKHVLLTGVTGFVGEALLQLMLAEVPGAAPDAAGAAQGHDQRRESRIAALLQKPIFTEVVEAAGGVEALMEARVTALEGDLADVPPLPADLDALVHCAGDVSFDPPVDEGFRTNVVGTRDLLGRMAEAGGATATAHYVHISTAYVAGRRRGVVAEGPVDARRRPRGRAGLGPGAAPVGRAPLRARRPCSRRSAARPRRRTAAPAC